MLDIEPKDPVFTRFQEIKDKPCLYHDFQDFLFDHGLITRSDEIISIWKARRNELFNNQPQTSRLLHLLEERPGYFIGKERLAMAIYNNYADEDEINGIRCLVFYARKSLGKDRDIISLWRGIGYGLGVQASKISPDQAEILYNLYKGKKTVPDLFPGSNDSFRMHIRSLRRILKQANSPFRIIYLQPMIIKHNPVLPSSYQLILEA